LEKHQPVIIYMAVFLLFSLLLRITGLIEIENLELLSYMLMIFGISYLFISFGRNRKGVLFTSTVIFLTGILMYLLSNFEFFVPSRMLYPSIIFIAGTAFLMIYIDGGLSKRYLFISTGLIVFSLILIFIRGDFKGSSFLNSLIIVAGKYWIILLLVIIIFLLIVSNEKKRDKEL